MGIVGQEILHENSRVFEHLTFSVTALLDRDWDELKAEWEGPDGYGSDAFDLEGHLSKRADRTIRLQREFWFDVTAWADHSIYGLPLPLEISGFRRGHTTCHEMQSPGLGYSAAYNDALNGRIATIYVYDFGMTDIPACLTHPEVIEQFERSLSDVMGSDEALARKSELLRRFSMGDPTSGKGFLGAILSLAPALLDTFEPVEILFFELYRRNVVCITVTTFRVVEHLDVIEDIPPGLFAIRIDFPANALPLE